MSFGIVGTDVMERINWVRLREEKKQKALKVMKEAGLGAILTMYEENIRYISSTHGPEWTKTIPGQPSNTSMVFIIQAYDQAGHMTTSSIHEWIIDDYEYAYADLNGDGKIDIKDIARVAKLYGL